MPSLSFRTITLIAILSASLLPACSGSKSNTAGSTSSPGPAATFTIGGTVTGLGAGETVVLRNNGGDDLSVTGSGAFTFRTAIANGASYAVTVFTQPVGKTCAVSGGAGMVPGANVTTISVACTTALAIAPVTLPNGVFGVAYAQTITATNGVAPATFAAAGGLIPPGLLLNANGLLNGVPAAGGRFDFNVRAADSTSPPQTGMRNYSVLILEITTKSAANGSEGQPYNHLLAVTGEVGAVTWKLAPGSAPLPPGLALQAAGAITGVPTQGGVYTFDVEATDSDAPPRTTGQRYTIRILQVTTAVLPNGTEDQPYVATLAITGQVGAVTWTLAPGSAPLPPGLSLSADGSIAGTPTESGTFNFTVQATDSDTPARTGTRNLSITVAPFEPVASFEVVNVLEDGTVESNIFINNRTIPSDKQYSISGDGRYVAFTTTDARVLLRDTCKGSAPVDCEPSTRSVSAERLGSDLSRFRADSPAISANARWVAFRSTYGSEDLNHQISSGDSQFYVHDTCVNATTGCVPRTLLIPERTDDPSFFTRGVTSPHSIGPAISADGRFVLFSVITDAGLTPELPNANQQAILVHDRDADGNGIFDENGNSRNHVVSYRPGDNSLFGDNQSINDFPTEATLSGDGGTVAMVSAVPGLPSFVFLHDRSLGFTFNLLDLIPPNPIMVNLAQPDLSLNGRAVGFVSSDDVVEHVFYGFRAGSLPDTTLVTANVMSDGGGGLQPPSLSTTGRFLAFSHFSDDLGAGNSPRTFDVFVWDSCGEPGCVPVLRCITGVFPSGQPTTLGSIGPRLSADGAYVVFVSADRLDPNAPAAPGLQRIFIAPTGVRE
jgi:hypothetical protein